jgi:glutamine amidotransferase-like uncharacterized protein
MKKPTAGIFLHHPECSVQSGAGIYEALISNFDLDFFQISDISDTYFENLDMIIFPGGIGDSDSYDYILKPFEHTIRKFVGQGKKYLGICMGAYWAGPYYFDLIKDINPVQYIKRPNSEIQRSFGTTVKVNWNNIENDMFFYDGCSLLGNTKEFDVISTYSNGDPMAIIQGNVGLIGCHPESMPSWYLKKYLKDRWHNFKHHELLLDFANNLLKN